MFAEFLLPSIKIASFRLLLLILFLARDAFRRLALIHNDSFVGLSSCKRTWEEGVSKPIRCDSISLILKPAMLTCALSVHITSFIFTLMICGNKQYHLLYVPQYCLPIDC